MRQNTWNDKVAKKRGPAWRAKLAQGRLDASLVPTILRVTRVKKALSQKDISDKLDMSLSTYGAIERGFRPVKGPKAKLIARTLGTSPAQIFAPFGKSKFLAK